MYPVLAAIYIYIYIYIIILIHMQIWDRRHGDHPVKQVPVHNGPVYCCDWHPENDNWILSAGRDKMIKARY